MRKEDAASRTPAARIERTGVKSSVCSTVREAASSSCFPVRRAVRMAEPVESAANSAEIMFIAWFPTVAAAREPALMAPVTAE